jgi:hypothetical protein
MHLLRDDRRRIQDSVESSMSVRGPHGAGVDGETWMTGVQGSPGR